MKNKKFIKMLAAFGCLLILICGAANFASAQQTDSNDKLTAEIEKGIRDLNDAYTKRDGQAFSGQIADGGFLYDAKGFISTTEFKPMMSAYLQSPQAAKSKNTYQISDLKVAAPGADSAVANYTTTRYTESADGKKSVVREQNTDFFVRRDGRWQIFAEHSSLLPKEPDTAGLPTGWRFTPMGNNVVNYRLTVDTAVKHGGKASASIKGICANNDKDWVSLAQSIAADDFRGKRVRLTGWIKTENSNKAGLWMRVDGNRKQSGFDNMDDRAVSGTTAWKQYSVVLDVPADAVNIYFGTLVQGAGNVWVDDFKIETVGSEVASTNKMTAEEMKSDNGSEDKPETNKKAVNLDFEAGAVAKMN